MYILGYDTPATVAGLDGVRHLCPIAGLVEPDNPGVAALGHSPATLAEQGFRDLVLGSASELAPQAGLLVFADGSPHAAKLSLRSSDGGTYAYALTLEML